jgi:hypothetical protein
MFQPLNVLIGTPGARINGNNTVTFKAYDVIVNVSTVLVYFQLLMTGIC